VKASQASTGQTGTHPYTAPEVLVAHIVKKKVNGKMRRVRQPYDGFAADMWSLGATIYRVITGKFVFGNKTMAEL
jgi:serine/threonine protein kinase